MILTSTVKPVFEKWYNYGFENADFPFSGSPLSSKLLQLAGHAISDECESNPLYQSNEYRVTSGGNSNFKKIVHYAPSKIEYLSKNVEDILKLIELKLLGSSVAFPAIGTGN